MINGMSAQQQRIGVFGGTFDPVHYGHIASARELLERLSLDVMYLMPCRLHPHRKQPGASALQRLAMLNRALADEPDLQLDERELKRTGLSFTVDSLTALREEQGDDVVIVFVLGSDAFAGLHTWHRWQSLFELANIAVIERAGQIALADIQTAELRERLDHSVDTLQDPAGGLIQLRLQPYDISSTALRNLLQQTGRAKKPLQVDKRDLIERYLPAGVLEYIRDQQLYSGY